MKYWSAEITYRVHWEPNVRRFVIERNGKRTRFAATALSRAILLAIEQAKKEGVDDGLSIKVISGRCDRDVIEWESYPTFRAV